MNRPHKFPAASLGCLPLASADMPQRVEAGSGAFVYSVYGFHAERRYEREVVASFFNWGDAVDYATNPLRFGGEQRNLYMSGARYDRRDRGYRPAPFKPVQSYADWCAEVDARRLHVEAMNAREAY